MKRCHETAYSVFPTEILEGFAQVFASIDHLPIPEQRAATKKLFQIPENILPPILKAENKTITGRHGEIPLRIYTPNSGTDLPVIVFFHRGGFVYGSLDEAEMICRRLSNATGAIVISVEYRLSPEFKFPIPLEDCFDATHWVFKKPESYRSSTCFYYHGRARCAKT